MKNALNFWVIGGDMRQAKLAELLADDGHTVHTLALDKAPELSGVMAEKGLAQAALADCVVLPLPAEVEEGSINCLLASVPLATAQVIAALRPGQIVCAGRISPALAQIAQERGLLLHDYFQREELAIANAVPTAEGAVQIAMEELPITLHGARVLVVGYGRVGKLVAHRFSVLGARVSVAARKFSDLAWAETMGYGVEQIGRLAGWLCSYDLVINTVPARTLGEQELKDLKPGCLVVDLASKPGGVDVAFG